MSIHLCQGHDLTFTFQFRHYYRGLAVVVIESKRVFSLLINSPCDLLVQSDSKAITSLVIMSVI